MNLCNDVLSRIVEVPLIMDVLGIKSYPCVVRAEDIADITAKHNICAFVWKFAPLSSDQSIQQLITHLIKQTDADHLPGPFSACLPTAVKHISCGPLSAMGLSSLDDALRRPDMFAWRDTTPYRQEWQVSAHTFPASARVIGELHIC